MGDTGGNPGVTRCQLLRGGTLLYPYCGTDFGLTPGDTASACLLQAGDVAYSGFMNSLSCPNCGTSFSVSPDPPRCHPSVTPKRGRPPKPKPDVPGRSEANTIAVAHWLSLGGPLGAGQAHLLPGSVFSSPDVFERYHHWATRYRRPLMVPTVFGQVMRRLGVTGSRNGASRFLVFPPDLDVAPWLKERCPLESDLSESSSFDPVKLPWVRGLHELAAAEPDNPEWPALLEALPGRNWADPLNPSPEWLIPYDAADSGLGSDSSAAGGPPPAPSPSVEGVMSREAAAEALGLDTATEGLSVFARSTRAD